MSAPLAKALVAVIATGGTIASRRRDDGASTPALDGASLVSGLGDLPARLRPVELMAKDSSSLSFSDMSRISDAVAAELADPAVTGVVVLHGTDAMEETALLVQLQQKPEKPVIFTGAQFTADHPRADGPANLHEAVAAAIDPENASAGVLLAFGARLLAAWGLYKFSSDSADAFRRSRAIDPPAHPRLSGRLETTRIDIVALYPGCDAAHIEASLRAGAHGIVLAALGSGNANPRIVEAVRICVERGVPVVVSSRVPEGVLSASYGGGGGGHDLAAAGAVLARTLRPGQARILLAALVASGMADRAAQALSDYGAS